MPPIGNSATNIAPNQGNQGRAGAVSACGLLKLYILTTSKVISLAECGLLELYILATSDVMSLSEGALLEFFILTTSDVTSLSKGGFLELCMLVTSNVGHIIVCALIDEAYHPSNILDHICAYLFSPHPSSI